MALKPLSPIKTHTLDDFDVEIVVIDPSSKECFTGTIAIPSKGKVAARWDSSGICLNKPERFTLDMDAPELAHLIRIANEMRK